jgi:hypothetical protein
MGFGWGMDLGAEAIRLCHAAARGERIEVRRMADVALARGLLQPSAKLPNLTETAALADAVTRVARQAGCRGYVRVALPDAVFLLRSIVSDAVPDDPAAARQFLLWQARDLLPFPAEEGRLDYQIIGADPDGRVRTVCLIARARILAEYEELLGTAGLRVAVLDAHSVTMAQAISALFSDGSSLVLAGDGGRATLLVIEARRPRVWRILPFPWTVDGSGDRLLREVADSLTFFQESEGVAPLERVIVGGFGKETTALAERLSAWLELPASALDLCTIAQDWPLDADSGWGAALGAAIRPC